MLLPEEGLGEEERNISGVRNSISLAGAVMVRILLVAGIAVLVALAWSSSEQSQLCVPAQGVCTNGKEVLNVVSFWLTPVL